MRDRTQYCGMNGHQFRLNAVNTFVIYTQWHTHMHVRIAVDIVYEYTAVCHFSILWCVKYILYSMFNWELFIYFYVSRLSVGRISFGSDLIFFLFVKFVCTFRFRWIFIVGDESWAKGDSKRNEWDKLWVKINSELKWDGFR